MTEDGNACNTCQNVGKKDSADNFYKTVHHGKVCITAAVQTCTWNINHSQREVEKAGKLEGNITHFDYIPVFYKEGNHCSSKNKNYRNQQQA